MFIPKVYLSETKNSQAALSLLCTFFVSVFFHLKFSPVENILGQCYGVDCLVVKLVTH